MTAELAIDYINRRMKELGYGNDYYLRFRHFVLEPKEKRKIDAPNQLFILLSPPDDIAISSDFGIYDVTQVNINECQYEHQGSIQIRNYAGFTTHVKFIQVIPEQKKKNGS